MVTLDGEAVTSDDDWGDVDLAGLRLDFPGVHDVEVAATRRGEFLRSLVA